MFSAEYVKSKINTTLIKYRGYIYGKYYINGPKTIWKCSTRHNRGCLAKLYTVDDIIVKIINKHIH